MKKVVLSSLLAMAFSATCFASPMMDYSVGKVALDVNARPDLDVKVTDCPKVDGKSGNYDWGLTVGLGNNLAFQYKNNDADTKDYVDSGEVAHDELNAQEFNVLYKLNPNVAAFVGATKTSGDWVENGVKYSGKKVNGYQVGVIGTTPIAENVTAYGVVGAGNKIANFEAGLGYAFTENAEFNVFYKHAKYKSLSDYAGDKFDCTVKGIGYGLTFKF